MLKQDNGIKIAGNSPDNGFLGQRGDRHVPRIRGYEGERESNEQGHSLDNKDSSAPLMVMALRNPVGGVAAVARVEGGIRRRSRDEYGQGSCDAMRESIKHGAKNRPRQATQLH